MLILIQEHGVLGVMGRVSKDLIHSLASEEDKRLFADLKNFPFSGNRLVTLAGQKVAQRVPYPLAHYLFRCEHYGLPMLVSWVGNYTCQRTPPPSYMMI